MFIKREERKAFWSQVGGWTMMLIIPAVTTWFMTHSSATAWKVTKETSPFSLCLALIFFLNVYWLAPKYLLKDKKKKFNIYNNILTIAVTFFLYGLSHFFYCNSSAFNWNVFLIDILSKWGFCWIMVLFGQLVRTAMHQKTMKEKLKEEQQKRAESELAMLKNQLNPHFLFNTLNNISSMVQIDADKAQDYISQLCDLLRYTLYETSDKRVSLAGEIEFMNNYIDLMKLRCNELTKIETDMSEPSADTTVAPLIFISLIENAFKHGVNSRKPSFINISLKSNDNKIVFTVENSIYEIQGEDHIGSGIGLENMRRRLNLAYPDSYEFIHEKRNNEYFAQITIHLKKK